MITIPKCAKFYKDKEKLKKYLKKNKERYYNRCLDNKNSHKPWTDEENFLITNSNKFDIELAKELGRSIQSIQARRVRLKKRKEEKMNLELGNTMFNNNQNQKYKCPNYIIALLRDLDRRLSIIQYNIYQKPYESPFDNTGNSFIELSDLFEIHAYNWNENNSQEYNFIFKVGPNSNLEDIKISWYKYLGRDTTINIDMNGSESVILDLYQNCLDALDKYEKENININKNIYQSPKDNLNEDSEWEIGNCNDDEIIYLNLKGKADRKFSRFHLNIKDVTKLINDLNLTIMRSYYENQPFKIIRNKKEN